jgi:hypothetical protein
MAIFRVQKTKNYTVMSNHHLRNKALSLKAKGLLSQMLSLSEDWDYTLKGLSHINRESIDAVRTAVHELERAGYITRSRRRNGKGQLVGTDYIVREHPEAPAPPDPEPPSKDEPTEETPAYDEPTWENPMQDKATQLNKEVRNKDKSKKESYPILSSFPKPSQENVLVADVIDKDMDRDNLHSNSNYEKQVWGNIGLDGLLLSHPKDRDAIMGMYRLIVDTVCGEKKSVRISGSRYSPEYVRKRLLRLTSHHILYILDSLSETATKTRNMKSYLLAALFNAPLTIDSYYTNRVNRDRACGRE